MSRTTTTVFTAILLAALSASTALLPRVDRLRSQATLEDVLYVPSGTMLKRMSLGYSGLLADIYWTRAVQYFGNRHYHRAARYDLLAPLLDITTEIDPHLLVAYQFGSIFLSQPPPEGSGQPEKAIALVERGIRENPTEWRLYYNLGWIEFDRKNYTQASRDFDQAANVKGAPPSMSVLAAAVAQRGGDVQTARFLWTQLYNTTTDEMIRANARKRLQSIEVDEEVASLEAALQSYRQTAGRYPDSLSQLAAWGWHGPIHDPEGWAFLLKPEGRIEVQQPERFPFLTRGLPPGATPPDALGGGRPMSKSEGPEAPAAGSTDRQP